MGVAGEHEEFVLPSAAKRSRTRGSGEWVTPMRSWGERVGGACDGFVAVAFEVRVVDACGGDADAGDFEVRVGRG